jgi:hypothetical protein
MSARSRSTTPKSTTTTAEAFGPTSTPTTPSSSTTSSSTTGPRGSSMRSVRTQSSGTTRSMETATPRTAGAGKPESWWDASFSVEVYGNRLWQLRRNHRSSAGSAPIPPHRNTCSTTSTSTTNMICATGGRCGRHRRQPGRARHQLHPEHHPFLRVATPNPRRGPAPFLLLPQGHPMASLFGYGRRSDVDRSRDPQIHKSVTLVWVSKPIRNTERHGL